MKIFIRLLFFTTLCLGIFIGLDQPFSLSEKSKKFLLQDHAEDHWLKKVPKSAIDSAVEVFTYTESFSKKITSKPLTEGRDFPLIQGRDITGAPLNFATYKGKVVLINIWESKSTGSLIDIQKIRAVYSRYYGKGLRVIGIGVDTDLKRAQDVIKAQDILWPQVIDGNGFDGDFMIRNQVTSVPLNVLVNREGKIVALNFSSDRIHEVLQEYFDSEK